MPKLSNIYKECSRNCKSKQHAAELISAITLPSSIITDRQLADELGRTVLHIAASCGRKDLCQWLIKCCNADIDSQDLESGYTSLHNSIFYGHINVTVLLIQQGANINICDWEFFLPVDMVLENVNLVFISYSMQTEITSKYNSIYSVSNTLNEKTMDTAETSYDHLYKMSITKLEYLNIISNSFSTEVFTWGSNHNYTIGFGAETSKTYPEFLEFFEKKNEIIIEICMHNYHTLFISLFGNVWSCGLGKGGRLGLSSDETILIPQKIMLKSKIEFGSSSPNVKPLFCIKAAVGMDHSIFLCNDNQILTCGMNTYHQLGILPPPISVNKPQIVEIKQLKSKILGVAASTFHSVVWTSTTLYTCGLHGGQLGHPYSNEKSISFFKKVINIEFQYTNITNLVVSEGATVIATEAYDIYLLSAYKCQKIDFKHIVTSILTEKNNILTKRENNEFSFKSSVLRSRSIIKIAIIGGNLDNEKIKPYFLSYRPDPLKIALLFWDGSIFLWQESIHRFMKCIFIMKRDIKISAVVLNSNGMLLSTHKGEAFTAQIQNVIKTFAKVNDGFIKVNHRNNQETQECFLLKVKKIKNAHRTINIFSDVKGCNFAILQCRSVDFLENMPQVNSSVYCSDFETLLQETCVYDSLHDIIFQVGTKLFAAHKYILASCCNNYMKSLKEINGVVIVNDVHPAIFEEMLIFAYTGSSSFLKEGPCSTKIQSLTNAKNINSSSLRYENPLELSIKAAKQFDMNKYIELLKNFSYENEHIYRKEDNVLLQKTNLKFNRSKLKNLYDIKLKSQDGKIFSAHKCILIARMQYFKSMLSGNWIESSKKYSEYHNMPVSGSVLLEILEFLYTDTTTKSINKKDVNFWCSLLVAADQFMLQKLKEISENALAHHLDTRNTCDILIFANVMNANQLVFSCFEFICINLASFIYSRSLEKLDDLLMNRLTKYYQNKFKMKRRNIPIYNNSYDPKEIIHAENICPINWEIIYEPCNEIKIERKPLNPVQKKEKKKRTRKSSLESECVYSKENKSNTDEKNYFHEISTSQIETINEDTSDKEWVEVNKQLKSVKARLKANTAVKSYPQLVEQKENFTPLKVKENVLTCSGSVVESEIGTKCHVADISGPLNYKFHFDFQNLTPKISQKQMKRRRRVSESNKTDSRSQNVLSEQSHSHSENSDLSIPDHWGMKNRSEQTISFSAIMESEMKQKTVLKKETKRIETKSLHLTQIEDKAIQELITFYNINNVDDEFITVHRVIYDTEIPQWIIK
ncbi:hypothetical protein PGB90_000670 [Kerria lacca]